LSLPAVRKTIIQARLRAMIVVARIKKGWQVINVIEMKIPHKERELVLMMKSGLMNEEALEKELYNLEELFQYTESPEMFCITHELVSRNRVTRKKNPLLISFYKRELKPFHFLIGRN
jgi:hypothetical protein